MTSGATGQLQILGTRGIPARHGGYETFAEEFARYLVDRGVDVVVCLPATENFAERPASEQLIKHELTRRGMNSMRSWEDALADYVPLFQADLDGQS